MWTPISDFLSRYKLPILSGVLIGTTYIPFPPWSSLFCLVPLWMFWLQNIDSWKRIWWSGWITQFLLTLIGFNWVAHTLHEFGHAPLPLAFVGLFAFCCFGSLHIAVAGLLWRFLSVRLRLSRFGQLLLLPLAVAVLERVSPMIFDWHFGYTWYWVDAPMIHTAELWGFRFLSAFTIFFNLSVLLVFELKRNRVSQIVLAAAVAILISLNGLGLYLKSQIAEPDSKANVLIVQANIGNLEKIIAETGLQTFRDRIVSKYSVLTREGVEESKTSEKKIDFAIWPETAYPDHILPGRSQSSNTYSLMTSMKELSTPLVMGSYGYNPKTTETSNSMYIIDQNGVLQPEHYTKTVLLAFGEYIPGANWFPIIKEWIPQVAYFERGKGPTTLTLNGMKLGPQICYEGLFDWFSRDLANMGSQIMVNVTNDSWYGTSMQPYQHLYMTLARAIETRLPLVRSTNTGISTVVLASGEVLEPSPLHVPWKGLYEVEYLKNPKPTIFSGFGYWITDLFFILWGALIVYNRFKFGKSQ